MDGRAKIYRDSTSDEEARATAERIKTLDYELMGIVTGDPLAPNPLTPRASAALVRMQRQLRALRIDMEVERGFDTSPRTLRESQTEVGEGNMAGNA